MSVESMQGLDKLWEEVVPERNKVTSSNAMKEEVVAV
jgi:hypothetical protein